MSRTYWQVVCTTLLLVLGACSSSEETKLPSGLTKGPQACPAGQKVAGLDDAGAVVCAADTDTDTTLTEAQVDVFVSNNGFASADTLAPVALTGSFADLLGVPASLVAGPQLCPGSDKLVGFDAAGLVLCAPDVDTQLDEAQVDALVANNGFVAASSLAPVATAGTFDSLSGVPAGLAIGPQSCAGTDKAVGIDTGGAVQCAPDTDTTYDGTTFALSGQPCPAGQVSAGTDAAGQPVCAARLPGIARASSLRIRATGGASTAAPAVLLDGVSIVPAAAEVPGIFVAVIDRATHAVELADTYAVDDAATGTAAWAAAFGTLSTATREKIVVVATRGPVNRFMRTPIGGPAPWEVLTGFGASARPAALLATDAYALVGTYGAGKGNGLELVTDSARADAELTELILDGDVGLRTAPRADPPREAWNSFGGRPPYTVPAGKTLVITGASGAGGMSIIVQDLSSGRTQYLYPNSFGNYGLSEAEVYVPSGRRVTMNGNASLFASGHLVSSPPGTPISSMDVNCGSQFTVPAGKTLIATTMVASAGYPVLVTFPAGAGGGTAYVYGDYNGGYPYSFKRTDLSFPAGTNLLVQSCGSPTIYPYAGWFGYLVDA